MASIPTVGTISAGLRVANTLVLAYQDGRVEARPLTGGGPTVVMQDPPSGRAQESRAGPGHTIMLSYDLGWLAIWDLRTGALLVKAKLNGWFT